jgi:sulfate transport system substrate-binding protein
VDKVVDKKGTREVAQAYLEFLYTKQGQEIAARNFYRPRDAAVAAQYAERYPPLSLLTIQDFGGWDTAQAAYFADGGMFDRAFTPGR